MPSHKHFPIVLIFTYSLVTEMKFCALVNGCQGARGMVINSLGR